MPPRSPHRSGESRYVAGALPGLPFEAAPVGATYVIGARLREKALQPRGWRACSLRPQFMRLIKRAGLKPWSRPFHNLRASRETELMHKHPIHVVTAWLGNSPQIAMKHYCIVTDEDFKKARQNHPDVDPNGGRESGAATARHASQRFARLTCKPFAGRHFRDAPRRPAKPQNGGHGIRTRNRFPGI